MKLSWRDQRDYLCRLVKICSITGGGDDSGWLRGYAQDVIKAYSSDLGKAIACFEDLLPIRSVVVDGTGKRLRVVKVGKETEG